MNEQLNEEQTAKLVEVTKQLKGLLDVGSVGARAASTEKTLVPGDLIDLVWRIIFGKNREECLGDEKAKGAAFVLSVWNGHPMVGWHLNNVPRAEIVMVLATAIAMVGKRLGDGKGIINATMAALEALREAESEDGADEETKH